jgi:hypothetical protein
MVGVVVVGGYLYPSTTKQPLGVAVVDGRTGHCLVRQPRHPTVRVRELSTVGGFIFSWHWTD